MSGRMIGRLSGSVRQCKAVCGGPAMQVPVALQCEWQCEAVQGSVGGACNASASCPCSVSGSARQRGPCSVSAVPPSPFPPVRGAVANCSVRGNVRQCEWQCKAEAPAMRCAWQCAWQCELECAWQCEWLLPLQAERLQGGSLATTKCSLPGVEPLGPWLERERGQGDPSAGAADPSGESSGGHAWKTRPGWTSCRCG
eukprot:1156788-Pelagomonas_calceolata.AAC.9